ncbi:MAG: hypothetical protein R3C18_14445 [Planctomycetaceae bacterium]
MKTTNNDLTERLTEIRLFAENRLQQIARLRELFHKQAPGAFAELNKFTAEVATTSTECLLVPDLARQLKASENGQYQQTREVLQQLQQALSELTEDLVQHRGKRYAQVQQVQVKQRGIQAYREGIQT